MLEGQIRELAVIFVWLSPGKRYFKVALSLSLGQMGSIFLEHFCILGVTTAHISSYFAGLNQEYAKIEA